MRMSSKIVFNVLAASVSMAGGILRNKIFAAFLSVNLFGILSIGQQSSSLLFTFFAFGLPLGITTLASELLAKSERERIVNISRIVVLSIVSSLLFFILLMLIVALDPYFISRVVTNKEDYALPIGIVLLSSPLMVAETCLFSIMEGMGMLKEITKFRVVPVLITLPALYFLVSQYYLVGAAVGLVLSEAFMIANGIYLLRKHISIGWESFHIFSVIPRLIKVAILSFLVGLTWMATDFITKRYMLGVFGEVNNSIVQSVAKITDIYPSIALSWLTMHLFPAIAVNANDRKVVANVVQRTMLIAVSLVVPIIIVLFALRPIVLEVLYKKEFVIAVNYFGAMLTTGIPKVFSWVLGLALLPLGMKKQWFYSTMIFVAVYVITIWSSLSHNASIYSIPIAFGVAVSVQAVYTLLVLRKHGIVFIAPFRYQVAIFAAMVGLFIASLFSLYGLALAGVLYAFMLYRYDLFSDIKGRLNEIAEKAAR